MFGFDALRLSRLPLELLGCLEFEQVEVKLVASNVEYGNGIA